jgi:hypothetical protein
MIATERGAKSISKAHHGDPCAEDGGCLIPPAEFVRLRYFFGQRLGVVDLADEQSYLVGKQRFHNLRAHGAGVLCGLRAERYVFPQGSASSSATTLLRVRRGAALDWCGREIVVGWDQCIDVSAWLNQHPQAHPSSGSQPLQFWVALCYRECPSDPAPAPRDPCGCDAGGCEFARTREGFELKLLTDAEASAFAPGEKDSDEVGCNAEEVLGGSLESAYARLAAAFAGADCPGPVADSCLLLANFQATLDSSGKKITNITAPDNAIPERRSLLSTARLQKGLLRALAAAGDAELTGSGPHLSAVTFLNGSKDSGTLSIEMLTGGTDLSRDPFAAPAQLTVSVSHFKDIGTWEAAPAFSLGYVAGTPARIEVQWASGSGLLDGGRYRVLIEGDRKQPPVDQKMRPLTPLSWARHFRLVKDKTGNLVLAESLY